MKKILFPVFLALISCPVWGQTIDIGFRSSEYKSCPDLVNGRLYVIRDDSLLMIDLKSFGIVERIKWKSSENLMLPRYEPLVKKGRLYVVDQEGGMVMRLEGDSVIRIDQSYRHQMQTLSTFFVFQDTIFRFGGYGYWSARNFFTYYNEKSNDLQAFAPLGSKVFPPGLFSAIVHPAGRDWFVLGGESIRPAELTGNIKNSDLWKFSLDELKWERLGELTIGYPTFLHKISYGNQLILVEQNRLSSLDFLRNRIEIYPRNRSYEIWSLPNFNSFYYDGYFFINRYSLNEVVQIIRVPEAEFLGQVESRERLYSSHPGLKILSIILSACALLSLSYYFVMKFRSRARRIKRTQNQFSYNTRKMELDDQQIAVFNLLMATDEVSSDDIIQVAGNEGLHSSQNIRIKNTIIDQMNLKFNVLLGSNEKLITIASSKIDKRMKVYRLKKDYFVE